MNATQGHAENIYLVMLMRKKSYAPVTFGPPFSTIVSSQSKNVMRVRSMI